MRAKLSELHPDLLFLQEIRGYQFDLLSTGVWPNFSYGKNAVYVKGHHGNAILSKFPIIFAKNIDLSSHRYDQRGMLHAIVELENNIQPLHLLCVHLGLFRNARRQQLDKIASYIKYSIPDDEPLILGGDFNDWTKYATKPLIDKLGLHEAFLNYHGDYARTYPAWAPVLQLDRIYVRGFQITKAERLQQAPWKYFSDHLALEVNLTF